MADIERAVEERPVPKNRPNLVSIFWVSVEYVSFRILEVFAHDLRIVRRENRLFLGLTLLLLGVFNWSSGKYCDGNTSDYLSCTRPDTYYYYGAFQIFLIIAGAILITVWWQGNKRGK